MPHLPIDSLVKRAGAGPTVTFVGHDASRTGAPVMLYSFLRWLQTEEIEGVQLVLLAGGPMLADYQAVVPTQVLSSRVLTGSEVIASVTSSLGHPLHMPQTLVGVGLRSVAASPIVVANTLASLGTAKLLADRASTTTMTARLVCHVHELDGVAQRILPASLANRSSLLDSVDRFIAASEAVAAMLVDRLCVDASKVTVIEEFIERPNPTPAAMAAARKRISGGTNRPVILNVGAMSHRKGPERFVDLMSTLADHPSLPLGVWLGGERNSSVWAETEHDLANSNLADTVLLLPTQEDSASYIAAADLVVSTAIEDPFPLSVLEAAAAAKAVVAFESGGVIDMLSAVDHPELIVPIGDTLGMSAAVASLLENSQRRELIGSQLADWVGATHLVQHMAPILWQTVTQ